MNLPTLRRPFPVAARARTGELYETEHPRLAALRFCREKIVENRAGLDPYDDTVFVLVAREHETVWARHMLDLVGVVIGEAPEPGGGMRYRAVLESDVRVELGCDTPHPPIKADEALASRGVDAPAEAILHVLHPPKQHLQLVVDNGDPDPVPAFRPQLERAARAAALQVDCGCGAPSGMACACTVGERLASAAAAGASTRDEDEAHEAAHSRELREQRWLSQQPNREVR